MNRNIWSGFVIAIFMIVNVFLVIRLLTITKPEGEPDDYIPRPEVEAVKDGVFLHDLVGSYSVADDGTFTFDGIAHVRNVQDVPVKDAVVTMQHVSAGGVQIVQGVTNEDGEAELAVSWTAVGIFSLQLLDVTGVNYQYRKDLNVLDYYQDTTASFAQ